MCVFVYTMTRCEHKQFQNVSECSVARGAHEQEPTNRGDLTAEKPVFLFDTSKSMTSTPEYYKAAFPCRKVKAIRPIPTLCDQCAKRAELAERLGPVGAPGSSSGSSNNNSNSTAGSPMGLAAGRSGSLSDLTNDSGASTPRSFWKLAHPIELI
ncbi:hypothetical protein KVR01_006403 [Diaporthe batatas]|uniref:uncharacterized protein n=1 Tax=Diaporthe batatas TaxID=748121 RepID=UPI001D04F8B0|nr:uncharacterized protein KVR01_006403 [Diaporthe batatas]KAG8164485.1 hypothetical protein KVR01_006403 [Diaporthe batatas]